MDKAPRQGTVRASVHVCQSLSARLSRPQKPLLCDLPQHGLGSGPLPVLRCSWGAGMTFRALVGKRTLSYPREGVTQIIGHTNPATVAGTVPCSPPRPPTARHVKESVSAIFVLQMRKPPTHPVGFSRRIQAKLFPVLQKLMAASWEPQMTEPCCPFSPTPTLHSPAGVAEGALSQGAGSPSGRVRRRGHLESWVPQEGPWHCPPPGGTLRLIFVHPALQQAPPAPSPGLAWGALRPPPPAWGSSSSGVQATCF